MKIPPGRLFYGTLRECVTYVLDNTTRTHVVMPRGEVDLDLGIFPYEAGWQVERDGDICLVSPDGRSYPCFNKRLRMA